MQNFFRFDLIKFSVATTSLKYLVCTMIFSDWFYFEFLRKNNDIKPNTLRLVFTSDRVGFEVVSGFVRALMV